MAKDNETVMVQLATRIPKELHRRLKLACVTGDDSVMAFVTAAIEAKLGTPAKKRKAS